MQKGRPSNLVLSPSDASLRVTAVGAESPAAAEERTAMSDVRPIGIYTSIDVLTFI